MSLSALQIWILIFCAHISWPNCTGSCEFDWRSLMNSHFLVLLQMLNQIKIWALTGPFRLLGLNHNVPLCKALYINQAFPVIINDLTALLKLLLCSWMSSLLSAKKECCEGVWHSLTFGCPFSTNVCTLCVIIKSGSQIYKKTATVLLSSGSWWNLTHDSALIWKKWWGLALWKQDNMLNSGAHMHSHYKVLNTMFYHFC